MIGKPEWFKRRKYSGWGLTPKTWQGWAYIAIFLTPVLILNIIPSWDQKVKTIFIAVWALFLIIDVFDMMRKLNNDERERIHEAIAERNALWGIIMVIVAGILYDIITNVQLQEVYVNPFYIAALVVALLIKAISNIYLDRKN